MTVAADEQGYDYYFARTRPAAVARLLERKHAMLFGLATAHAPSTVLEIGPGEGFTAAAARRAGVRYRALESSPTGTRLLLDRGFDVRCVTVPPFPDDLEPTDLVYASHVIEHLPGPDAVRGLLAGCRPLLTAGGRLALVFPDARYMGTDFWDCDYTHQWPSTPRRVRQAANDTGYAVRAVHECCLHLHGAPAKGLRALARLYPQRLLSALDPARDDFWYRGKMLVVADALVLLEVEA